MHTTQALHKLIIGTAKLQSNVDDFMQQHSSLSHSVLNADICSGCSLFCSEVYGSRADENSGSAVPAGCGQGPSYRKGPLSAHSDFGWKILTNRISQWQPSDSRGSCWVFVFFSLLLQRSTIWNICWNVNHFYLYNQWEQGTSHTFQLRYVVVHFDEDLRLFGLRFGFGQKFRAMKSFLSFYLIYLWSLVDAIGGVVLPVSVSFKVVYIMQFLQIITSCTFRWLSILQKPD